MSEPTGGNVQSAEPVPILTSQLETLASALSGKLLPTSTGAHPVTDEALILFYRKATTDQAAV